MVGKNNNLSECPFDLPSAVESARLNPVIEKYELALLMLLGFAGFSVLIGVAYNKIRHYIFRDFHSLDVIFDAGGRVSVSLTAVTVTSQLLWPVDFLQSPTIASKVGVAGSFFYTLGVVLSMIVFSVLCVHLKTRAPGAKTFPQIAYARFGRGVQIMFCVVALFTNLVIIANLIFAGKTTIDVLAKDTSTEFILFTLAVLFGSYCLIGGLGTTFYISYFNTALIFIITSLFILKVSYLVEPEVEAFTSVKSLHNTMSCLKGPEENYGNSFLTFRSVPGMIFGILTFLMAISEVFCDQANWQSRIAAKPREGMAGFLIATFLWVAIPTSISFVTSMTYKTMSFRIGTNLLTDSEIDEGGITGLVSAVVGMMACGSTYEGGLSNFYTNTTQDYSLLFSLIPGFLVSTLITVIVSLCDNKSKDKVVFNEDFIIEHSEDQIWDKLKTKSKGPEVEWLKTMSIDNPLNTYRRIYRKEFAAIIAGRILTPLHMEHVFARTRRVSTIGVIISVAIFLFIIPSVAASQDILTENQLRNWLSVCYHWCLIATVFVVIIPPIQEGLQIWRQYKRNKRFVVKHSSEISLTIPQQ